MSRRWMILVALLCPACAKGSGPPPDEGAPVSGSVTAGDPSGAPDPSSTAPPSTAPSSSAPAPPANGGTAAPPPASTPPQTGESSLDCQALWAVVDHVSCGVVRLLCAVLEAIPSAGAQVPCDVAVPLACGLASSAADAADALCPR